MSTTRISGRRSAILPTLIIAAVLVVAFAIFTSFWTDRLWYQSMDFQTVFTTMLLTRIGLFAAFGLVMAALVGGNAVLAYRLRSQTRLGPPTSPLLERYRELLDARLVWVVLAVAVLVGLFAGGAGAGQVDTFLAWRNGTPFGVTDPKFGLDVGFFVFDYPWWRFVASFLFGGDLTTLVALAELNLKLGAVSMASMAAFVSLDPEKLSDALLALRAPELLAFGVSYGYRMLPILVDEYVTVFEGQRLRHAPAERPGLLGWRVVWQWCVLAVAAFYPIMLNTAKNVRTTVEALETRGFTYGASNPAGRSLRLAYLRVSALDLAVLLATAVLVVAAFPLGARIPWLG